MLSQFVFWHTKTSIWTRVGSIKSTNIHAGSAITHIGRTRAIVGSMALLFHGTLFNDAGNSGPYSES